MARALRKKIFVTLNMASTIDGKIAPARRGFVKLGSAYDSQRMGEIRAEADCVVMGARTFLAYPKPLKLNQPKLVKARIRKGEAAEPVTVVISSRLDIPRNTPFELAKDFPRIIFTSEKAPHAARARLEKNGVHVIVAPGTRPQSKFILNSLALLGFQRILLEGGGELNSGFFEADLVDRIYLTLCPSLLGGSEAPTIFEGKGFLDVEKRSQWKLHSCVRKKDELYLIFDRKRS